MPSQSRIKNPTIILNSFAHLCSNQLLQNFTGMEMLKAERQCSEAGFVVKVLNLNIPLLNSSVKNYRHSAGKRKLKKQRLEISNTGFTSRSLIAGIIREKENPFHKHLLKRSRHLNCVFSCKNFTFRSCPTSSGINLQYCRLRIFL